jgi:large subunit ribosomal protein L10
MDNPRAEKVAVVAEVKARLDGAEAVVLTEYRGLNVKDLATLRSALREAGSEYSVYKNTMVRFAAKELNLEIDEMLVGPTAIAFTGTRPDGSAGDPVTLARALTAFGATNDNLVIKGGLLDGQLLSTEEITALSKIAPREELLARLAGGMAAPMQQFAALLAALPQKMTYALKALIEAGGAPGAPESAPAEEAPAEADSESESTAEADSESESTAEADSESEAPAEADSESEAPAEADSESEASAEADNNKVESEDASGDSDTSAQADNEPAGDASDDQSGDASEEQES